MIIIIFKPNLLYLLFYNGSLILKKNTDYYAPEILYLLLLVFNNIYFKYFLFISYYLHYSTLCTYEENKYIYNKSM